MPHDRTELPPIIFTTPSCGWAVRNFAALLEKGQAFDIASSRDADGNKIADFLAATPFAQTPTMVADGIGIWDSLLINDYIEERYTGVSLMPTVPCLRADARRWMHYCDRHIFPRVNAAVRDEQRIERAPQELKCAFDRIERDRLGCFEGPYFFGDQFSLVDLAFHTLFNVIAGLEQQFGLSAHRPEWAHAWGDAINSRPSIIRASALPEAFGHHGVTTPMRVDARDSEAGGQRYTEGTLADATTV